MYCTHLSILFPKLLSYLAFLTNSSASMKIHHTPKGKFGHHLFFFRLLNIQVISPVQLSGSLHQLLPMVGAWDGNKAVQGAFSEGHKPL